MNCFVLCTGRCGSLTFAQACRHLTNFTAGHETHKGIVGPERLAYPDDHIEADNRLSWMLGRLEQVYGDDAYYVHLQRDPEAVAASYHRRHYLPTGLFQYYRRGVLVTAETDISIARDLVTTVTTNIESFLRDKTRVFNVQLESVQEDFPKFLEWIGAEGDLEAAVRTWDRRHNVSYERRLHRPRSPRLVLKKLGRIGKELPGFVVRT